MILRHVCVLDINKDTIYKIAYPIHILLNEAFVYMLTIYIYIYKQSKTCLSLWFSRCESGNGSDMKRGLHFRENMEIQICYSLFPRVLCYTKFDTKILSCLSWQYALVITSVDNNSCMPQSTDVPGSALPL